MKFFKHLISVIYPPICIHCGKATSDDKYVFCASCYLNIAFSHFTSFTENIMTTRLISIRTLKGAWAPIFFKKDGPIKKVMYKIKYGNRPDLARKFGHMAVHDWLKLPDAVKPDVITYVPLHESKKSKRGYNQSEEIAIAVAETLKIPCVEIFKRISSIDTQTHLGRYDRLENQKGTIICKENAKSYQHIMLVDDIMTTGATVETCYDTLVKVNPTCLISVFTLAISDDLR